MNNIQDFHKNNTGMVINTNNKDYMRARKRNHIKRKQEETFQKVEELHKLHNEVDNLKKMISELHSYIAANKPLN